MGCVGVIITPELGSSQARRENPAQTQVFLLSMSPVRCLKGKPLQLLKRAYTYCDSWLLWQGGPLAGTECTSH